MNALLKALQTRKTDDLKNLIHHSDQGVQYASMDYVNYLKDIGIQISMSRKGNPYDNAFAESFMKTLKKEKLVLDWRKRQQSRATVRLSIEEILDRLPRSYTPELYQHKCDLLYQHIYDSYFGQGQSIYSTVVSPS